MQHYNRLKISRMIKIKGASHPLFPESPVTIEGYITTPVYREGHQTPLALLTTHAESGHIYLGEIDPTTKQFTYFDRSNNAGYLQKSNGRIFVVLVPHVQRSRLKTLDEILAIPGISEIRDSHGTHQ